LSLRESPHFGKYSVVHRIGVGGMAEVFKCRLSGIGGFSKLVVIKRMRPMLASDPSFLDMFFDEARIAANLCHPNIVQTYEIDLAEGLPYIAMEYVRGPTLSLVNRQERRRREPCRGFVARVLAGICAGLHYAHKAADEQGRALNIIHRDVSPQNVIISMDGMPKLLDFGVAKARGQLSRTQAGLLKGKVKYMAPEQFVIGGPVTSAVDVFAVGICLYEATTLTLPYSGDGELELMRNVATGNYKRPSEVVPGFDPRLEELILWAMAPDPARRCPDAATLQRALEEYADREGVAPIDVARYLHSLFPEASVEATLQTAYVDVESNAIVEQGESSAHAQVMHTQPERPSMLSDAPIPPPPPPEPDSAVDGADLPEPVSSNAHAHPIHPLTKRKRTVHDALSPPSSPLDFDIDLDTWPRLSRAPVWGAVIAVALVALFVLGIAVSRPRVSGPAPASMPAAAAPAAFDTPAPIVLEPKPEVRRVEALLAAAHAALSERRNVEAAELARQALAEHIDERRATALLLEATTRERERVRATPVQIAVAPRPPTPVAPPVVSAAVVDRRPGVAHPRLDLRAALARAPIPTNDVIRVPPEPAPVVAPPVPLPDGTPPVPQPVARPPAPAPLAAGQKVAPPVAASSPTIECPDGARLIVHSMPREAWCEIGGEREGPYLRLWPNGFKAIEGEYRHGKKHGHWLEFYEQGGERSRIEWRRGVQLW
jgi:serine/threonine protein kinase